MDLSMDKIDEIFDTPLMDVNGKDVIPGSIGIQGENVSFSYNK